MNRTATETTRTAVRHRARWRRIAPVAAALLALAGVAAACSSDEDAGRRPSTTVTTTSAPTPSTVSDADFESQATTAELMIRNAGTDVCAIVQAFGPASALPTPVNPTQTERGVRVVASLFEAAAAAAPPEAADDAAVLRQAAADLVAEGEAAGWQPSWLIGTKVISNPTVSQAFMDFQAAAGSACSTTTTAP